MSPQKYPDPEKGKIFGRLTVASQTFKSGDGKKKVLTVCVCGNTKEVLVQALYRASTSSCGCLRKDLARQNVYKRCYKHGWGKTRTYGCWSDMRRRCCDPKNIGYKNYGGRGIKVCDRWLNSFENFLEDMGERPQGMSLDRVNVDGDYEPSNCRWASRKEQNNNTTRSRRLSYEGRTQTISQWEQEKNLSRGVLSYRLDRGWDIEKALNTPALNMNRSGLTYEGITKTVAQWAKDKGINENTLRDRLKKHWSVEAALNTPVKQLI